MITVHFATHDLTFGNSAFSHHVYSFVSWWEFGTLQHIHALYRIYSMYFNCKTFTQGGVDVFETILYSLCKRNLVKALKKQNVWRYSHL